MGSAQNSSGTHQGVLEGTQSVLTQLKEHKEEATLVKAFMLLTRTTGKGKGKTGSMGAKKGTSGGSKGKGNGKNPKSKPIDGAKKPWAGRRKTKPQTLPSPRTYVSLN